ncbi:hypothetical protein OCU04_004518 [Sclerotinia nivalis]|uniref:Uncharacterized protein n=2 Tax=Sclerotinia nivalis TaxID=352851 RepID=A0A9X0ARK4_9HELO|nr:hypothetical protein OCU04_004518 [Sclerotinia nivalis]
MIQRIISIAILALPFVGKVSAANKYTTSSTSSAACVSTGVILSGQTACPASFVDASSTISNITSTSSVATIIPTTYPVEVSSVAGVFTTTSIPYPHTTSTIYGINTRIGELGSVVTETVILSTTICPITATEGEATPSPSSVNINSMTAIQSTITSTTSAASPIISSTSAEGVAVSSPLAAASSTLSLVASLSAITPAVGNTSSTVVILQTATVIPEAYTTQVSETVYAWSTVTTEGTSTVIAFGSSSSVSASVSSAACIPSGGVLLSGQTACPDTLASSTDALSGETTGMAPSAVIPTVAVSSETEAAVPTTTVISPAVSSVSLSGETTSTSSAACVASGVLLSGETACPETPIKAVTSNAAISAQPSTTSVTDTPMQSIPATEEISTPQPSSALTQPGTTTSPTIFTPTYATTSFLTKPTSASIFNSTSFPTITPSSVSLSGTGILIDTATLDSTETFTFAMPSVYSPTGTSDSSAVTAYSFSDSGVSKVSARGSLVVALGVMAIVLVV